MISLLALAVVGSWNYSGFLTEAAPTPPPVAKLAPASTPAIPDPVVPDNKRTPEVPQRPEVPALPSAPISRPAPAAIAPKPTLYRSTDAWGQAWEHHDAAYLTSFVEARNRSFVIPTYVMPRLDRASRCYNGRCN